ncbi:LPXTG cell wall anchor domain-containing protein [Streptococcus gallolyticus]|nr:LPXTG cell wall anchor domain-containing protein [Streptococcus gallolyticus]MBY5040640.1 LPXTG cell wall anchor domain-containing protein [Streptococcus gallolyticus]
MKEIFSIRKFKTGTHSARLSKVALASTVALAVGFAGTVVSADETTVGTTPEVTITTTANPATNLEEAQAPQSADNAALAQNAGTQSGEMVTEVPSPQLDEAVKSAETAGVEVTEEKPVIYDNLSDAQKDLANQVEKAEAATTKKVDNTKAVNDAKAKNAEIDAQNTAEKQRVEEANKTGQAKVDAENAAKKAAYEKDVEAYNKKVSEQKAAYDKALAIHTSTAPTKVSLQMEGRETQRDYNVTISSGKYDAKFTLDNATGKFTINTILDDGVKPLLGDTYIDGRINYKTTYNADTDKTTTVVTGISYETVRYVAHRANTAVNQNITITYYDPSGATLYTRRHNGSSSWSATINKTYNFSKDIVLTPGQTSDYFQVVRLFDDWILDSRSVIQARFQNTNGNAPEVPTPPTNSPKEPEYGTFTPEVPKIIPHVSLPPVKKVETAVHPVLVKQTPENIKSVSNTDNVDTNGQLVPKGSTQTWTLTNSALKAGRDVVTAYVMHDPFPAGFKIDEVATHQKNSAWILTTSESGQLQLSATEATLALFNANRDQDVAVPLAYFVGSPQNDGATYENTFETVITTPSGEYTVVSNTPVIYTPGNDPETPRPPHEPGGENPTPDDNLIQPKKDVVDEKGDSINGKSILPNSVLNYVAEQDFDQYKGMSASKDSIARGFLYVDDYKDEALDGRSMVVNSIKAANGDNVASLLEMYHVLSKDSLSTELQKLIADSGISPVGEFYLWVAKDPQAFYEAYVQKGLDITYNLSFKIKKEFTEGQITNQTFQIDYGNGYYGNIVKNDLPLIVVHKDVQDKGGQSINNGTVKLGDQVTYKLEGWVIPAGRGYDINSYVFVDMLQQSHDQYEGFKAEAKVDFNLSDGTAIKAGDDLSQYLESVYNPEIGRLESRFKADFLAQIPRDSEFGADGYISVKRIKAGEVINEYTLIVNDYEVLSNKVVTTTPEEPKPIPPVETKAAAMLPSTGETTGLLSLIGTLLLSVLGLAGVRNRKED